MLDLQIRLLYCQYGWNIKDIGKLLDIPESAVRMHIEQHKLDRPNGKHNNDVEVLPATTDSALPFDSQQTPLPPALAGIQDIKEKEVVKQQHLAPIIATIELSLLGKLHEAAKTVDAGNTNQLASIVNTFKRLTQDAVINTVVKSEKDSGGNTGNQMVVQVLQFKD